MKLRSADWAVLVRVGEIRLQCFQREFIARVASLCLGTERRHRRFCSINETSNREQKVIGVLRNPSSGRAAKCIQFQNQQRADVGDCHRTFLFRAIKVASSHCDHATGSERTIHTWNHAGDPIVHDAGTRHRRRVFCQKIQIQIQIGHLANQPIAFGFETQSAQIRFDRAILPAGCSQRDAKIHIHRDRARQTGQIMPREIMHRQTADQHAVSNAASAAGRLSFG